MTLEEIEKVFNDYKAALNRKTTIIMKEMQGHRIVGDDLEFLMTGYYEQERKFEQVAPQAIRILLPIAQAAAKVIATEELSGGWDEAMNDLEEAVKGLDQ